MSKIDTTSWGEFQVGKLFDIHPTKSYKMSNAELFDGGSSLVLANSSYNNGIGGTSSLPTTEKGGMITFSDTVDANTIFYQENDFIGYSHVQGLYPIGEYKDMWSRESLLFFASSFRKTALSKGFDYGNKFRRDIASTLFVKLPIDSERNPDWNYMEEYIKDIETRVCDKILKLEFSKNTERKKIDIGQWKKYRIEELFKAYLSKDDIQPKNIVIGETPLISSGKENNGIVSYIYDDTAKLWDANTITVDMFGKAFYQDKPYHCVSHGRVNILEPIEPMSEYSMKFVALAIEVVSLKKYEFNEMCTGKKLLKDEIYLPSKNNKPNWEYMEEYMKGVESKVCDNISKLESVIGYLG